MKVKAFPKDDSKTPEENAQLLQDWFTENPTYTMNFVTSYQAIIFVFYEEPA